LAGAFTCNARAARRKLVGRGIGHVNAGGQGLPVGECTCWMTKKSGRGPYESHVASGGSRFRLQPWGVACAALAISCRSRLLARPVKIAQAGHSSGCHISFCRLPKYHLRKCSH
jgi:hypothetical protein